MLNQFFRATCISTILLLHQLCSLKCVWKLNVQKKENTGQLHFKKYSENLVCGYQRQELGGEAGWRQLKVQTSSYKILTTRDVMHSLINGINTAICHIWKLLRLQILYSNYKEKFFYFFNFVSTLDDTKTWTEKINK